MYFKSDERMKDEYFVTSSFRNQELLNLSCDIYGEESYVFWTN